MTHGLFAWMMGAMAIFLTANAGLRHYVNAPSLPLLIGSLCLFTLGNLMMIRLMREQGLGLAISMTSVLNLILVGVIAFVVFGERPTGLQMAGMALGVVAVALIAWPQGAGR